MTDQSNLPNPAEDAMQALARKNQQAKLRKKRLGKIAGALAVVGLLVFGVWKFLEMRQRLSRLESRITFINGEVVLREPGGKERKGALGDLVPEGAVVRTPAGSVADIGFMGGGGVKLDGDTEVKMKLLYHKKEVRQIEIRLDKGRLFNKVPAQKGDSRFGIASPSCQTWVRGTGFFVEVGPDGTRVATRDGKVEVLPGGGGAAAMVSALQKVSVGGAGAGTVESVAQRERKLFAQLDRIHELDADGSIAELAGITNSLGMPLVPLLIEGGATDGEVVMFGAHPVRSRDFAAFIADPDRGHELKPTGPDDDPDAWRNHVYRGQPVGRAQGEAAEASDHPVVMVTWEDAVAFCAWLSEKEGRTYRLASDHEWSSAAGIGDREDPDNSPREKNLKLPGVFPWGGSFSPAEIQGNYSDRAAGAAFGEGWDIIEGYDDGFATTAPVGSFKPNAHGIHDLGGNVWEWCEDPYGRGGMMTLRGGSWFTFNEEGANTSYRIFGARRYRWNYVGFRIVEVVERPIEDHSAGRGGSKDFALGFNGQFDSVVIDGLKYDGSHPLTLEAWFRTKDRFREQAIISNAEYAGTGILITKGRIQFHVYLGGGYAVSSAPFTKVNELVHVAGVYDGEEVRLYLDGVLRGAPTKSGEKHRPSNQPFVIGANPEKFAPDKKGHFIKRFWGMIDEVRVSSTARYVADFEPPKRHRADAATMSLYHFDEGAGKLATDSSGNGHNGEIFGAWWIGSEGDPPVRRRR